jgi:hypothetical protein
MQRDTVLSKQTRGAKSNEMEQRSISKMLHIARRAAKANFRADRIFIA